MLNALGNDYARVCNGAFVGVKPMIASHSSVAARGRAGVQFRPLHDGPTKERECQ